MTNSCKMKISLSLALSKSLARSAETRLTSTTDNSDKHYNVLILAINRALINGNAREADIIIRYTDINLMDH